MSVGTRMIRWTDTVESFGITPTRIAPVLVVLSLVIGILVAVFATNRTQAQMASVRYVIEYTVGGEPTQSYYARDVKAHGGLISFVDERGDNHALVGGAAHIRMYRH